MASVNLTILIGNLGRDPELRFSPNGQAKAEFSVATTRSWKKDDQWQEETTWHNVVVWGQRAERAADQFKKGMQVYVQGRIDNRSWEDEKNPGQKKYRSEVVADICYAMGRKGEQDEGGYSPNLSDPREPAQMPGEFSGAPRPVQAQSRPPIDDLDDLPF